MLDSHLTMLPQVLSVVRAVNCELRRIGSIRRYLSESAAQTLVSAFVLSRIDYCNAFLYGCPQHLLNRVQKLQNNAARLVLRIRKSEHITPHLQSLHWLPVESRIKYKIAILAFGAITLTGPQYLSDLVHSYTPARQLRSSSDVTILAIPRVAKSFGDRSFYSSAPTVWNSLPVSVRKNILSAEICPATFRQSLKTHFFQLAFVLCIFL